MSYGSVETSQMGVEAKVQLAVDDTADDGNDITTAVVVLRDAVRGVLLANGYSSYTVDDAMENFGTVDL